MANKYKGEVGVTVGGTQYTLRPSTNAMCELEEQTGKTLAQVAVAAETGNLTMGRLMVWALLQACHGDEIKTPKDAGDWLDRAGGLDGIGKALLEVAAANKPKDEPGARPPTARALTGAASTSRRVGQA